MFLCVVIVEVIINRKEKMLDLTTLTSSPTCENLKCFVCGNYLSYFPISFCTNNKSVCGRCTIPDGLISFENEAFEEICQHFKFPCRFTNAGCSDEFLPKDIPEHEENCPFRMIECIIEKPQKCQWQGSLPDLLRHCENQHSDLILENYELEIESTDAEERDNLVKFEDSLLIFRRKYDPKSGKMKFSLSCSKYETNSKIYLYHFDNLSVTCKFNTVAFEADMKFNEVCLRSLYSHIKPATFLMKIKLPENEIETTVQNPDINTELLKILKCGLCSRITGSSVYKCRRTLTIICSSCKNKHHRLCNSCESFTSDVQIREISKLVVFPCKYRDRGCTFSSKHYSLNVHQMFCEYANVNCPFFHPDIECFWTGIVKHLCSHILDDHEDFIHTFEKIYQLRPNEEANMSFIRFSHDLFRLCYSYNNGAECCEWWIQRIGHSSTKYNFEVKIVDETSGLRFLIGAQCSNSTELALFKDDTDSCYIRKDQIKWLKERDWILNFRVRIFKMPL